MKTDPFSPVEFMGLRLRNRFIRSATMEGMASREGLPTKRLINLYEDLAKGGVALISTSATLPDPRWSMGLAAQLALHKGVDLTPWEVLVSTVHAHGTFISLQMSPFMNFGGKLAGPSSYKEGVVSLSPGEIAAITENYAELAAIAKRVGFDAVQVHAGHGYGLSQFLSPYFNRRDDAYGGSHYNRARILLEIRTAIARAAGEDFPCWIKMNSFDGIHGGLTPEQAALYAPILADGGYSAIEVTGGSIGGSHDSRGPRKKEEWREGYYLDGARHIKAVATIPVVAVGGIRTMEMVHDIFAEGIADMVSMSRPLIREPDLINRWSKGDTSRARCISCNGCFAAMMQGEGLCCVQEHPSEEHHS